MPSWQLVDTDLSTILLDLNDSTGANNASYGSVITAFGLGGSLKVADSFDAERFERPELDGGFTTFARRGLTKVTFRLVMGATSEANLRLGVGRLADIVTRGGILKIVTGATRYLRFEPSSYPQPYQGKDLELWAIHTGFKFYEGIDVELNAQPWLEGAEVTTSSVTVPDDPATSTKVRVFPVTVSGDLPTPARVRVQMDTGSAVTRILVANRARNTRAASYFADYLSDTGFLQTEATGRGWTVTLGTDVTGQTDANASPGSGTSIARISYATVAEMARRVRATRTTKIDSLRGAWNVWLRCKASASATHVVQLRWGPSTADPVPFSNDEVTHDCSTNAPPAFGYVELNLGRIYLPEETAVTLGGLALEVWSRRPSGSGNLDTDCLWLTPADNSAIIVVQGGSTESWAASQLVSPVSNPAGGTAGVTGENVQVRLDTTTDNIGTPPNAGFVWGTGRHRVTFDVWAYTNPAAGATVVLRVRNVTDSTNAITKTVTLGAVGIHKHETLSFDGVAAKAYQPQVDDPSAVEVAIGSITHEIVPVLALNESARTDPGLRYSVDRLDSSAGLSGYLSTEGKIPCVLDPGDNHIMIRCDEVPLVGYDEGENKLARTPTVTVAYTPRYAL